MLEHMAFKGTTNRNAFEIAKEIEDVGGDINAYTSKESTAYYVKLLPENLNLGIEILSDIFLNSTILRMKLREREVLYCLRLVNLTICLMIEFLKIL